jgi:hypothetical protein
MKEFNLKTSQCLILFNGINNIINKEMPSSLAFKMSRNLKFLQEVTKPFGETVFKAENKVVAAEEAGNVEVNLKLHTFSLKELDKLELAPQFFFMVDLLIEEDGNS